MDNIHSSLVPNSTNSNGASSLIPATMSPRAAVRSIISSYLHDKNVSTTPVPAKPNPRVRPERKYGEDITDGNVLQQLKQKAQLKNAKQSKRRPTQRSQRLSKKKN